MSVSLTRRARLLQITRVKVHDCSPHKTCVECLAANDPYCGWCSLEGRSVVNLLADRNMLYFYFILLLYI